ncbi:MAG: flagellar hook-associated protein 3 [Spirochaetota bacterium]
MQRISTNMPNDDMQYYARQREARLLNQQNQIASQNRIQQLRDDPAAAAHASRHDSYRFRLERYAENIETAQLRHRESEVYMREAVDILQRARELAVQGANGTYTREDTQAMAAEVNQLLNQLVEAANAKGGDGAMLFAGDRTMTQPFRTIEGRVAGFDEPVIAQVQYLGTTSENRTEIADGSYVPLNFAGNKVFWAENQQVWSSVDATSYVVPEDATIRVADEEVQLRAGDNISAIIARINDAGAPVRARLDPIQNSLVLETTTPQQLWVQDGEGSDVLADLGIVSGRDNAPPQNLASSARVFGGSTFDMLVNLRDQLASGDTIDIGGRALGGMDSALDNVLGRLGQLGSYDERLQVAFERTENAIPEITARYSNEVDVDMTEAITELRMLEYTHRAALGAAARIMQPTLLDFLR